MLGQLLSLLHLLPRVQPAIFVGDVAVFRAGAVLPVIVMDVRRGVVLVLHRVPGHAVWLAGLRHAQAGRDLPGFIRSHVRFFPGETARVCSPW
jgi:hypothetical protein